MNLYRLDYADGTPIRDTVMGGDYLTHRFAQAVQRAGDAADTADQAVIVTRISGGGQMKAVRTVRPITSVV